MIYFIENGSGYVKIGYTTRLQNRLSFLQTGSPMKLNVLRVIDGDRKFEHLLHRHFKEYRAHGEWFTHSQEIADFIAAPESTISELLSGAEPIVHKEPLNRTLIGEITTVKDLVGLWGSDESAAQAWGTNAAVVQKMRLANRLVGWHLLPIWKAAQRQRLEQVTDVRLMELAERKG